MRLSANPVWFASSTHSNLRAILTFGRELTNSNLQGTIPFTFAMSGTLQSLILSNNQISGSWEWLLTVPNLLELSLSSSQVSGNMPEYLFGSLTTLNIANTRVTGKFPTSVGGVHALYVSNLGLTGTLPSDVTGLTLLAASNNALEGTIAGSWGSSLTDLYLSGNQLTGTIPASLFAQPALEELYLDDNRLTGSLPANASTANWLYFFANSNYLSGSVPLYLRSGTIRAVDISDNCFTCPLPSWCADSACMNKAACHGACTTTFSVTPSLSTTPSTTSSSIPPPSASARPTHSLRSPSHTRRPSATAAPSPSVTASPLPCGPCYEGQCVGSVCVCALGYGGSTCSTTLSNEETISTIVAMVSFGALSLSFLGPLLWSFAMANRYSAPSLFYAPIEPAMGLLYLQQAAAATLFPGTLQTSAYAWAQSFSWTLFWLPLQAGFPVADTMIAPSIGRAILGVEAAEVVTNLLMEQMLWDVLFWVAIAVLVTLVTAPLTGAALAYLHDGLGTKTATEATPLQLPQESATRRSTVKILVATTIDAMLALAIVVFFPLVLFSALTLIAARAGYEISTFATYAVLLTLLLIGGGVPVLSVLAALGLRKYGTAGHLRVLALGFVSSRPWWMTFFLLAQLTVALLAATLQAYANAFYSALCVVTLFAGITLVVRNPFADLRLLPIVCSLAVFVRSCLLWLVVTLWQDDTSAGNVSYAIILLDCLVVCSVVALAFVRMTQVQSRAKRDGTGHEGTRLTDILDTMELRGSMVSLGESGSIADLCTEGSLTQILEGELEVAKRIGYGSFGVVYQGLWHRASGEDVRVALKEFDVQESGEDLAKIAKELSVNANLRNRHVVQFFGVAFIDGTVFLVSELVEIGTIRDVIVKGSDELTFGRRLQLAIGAAEGLAYIHSKQLIHRDVKATNFLVGADWCCKLADFGEATIKTHTRTMSIVGTNVYMAPEVMNHEKYSEKADVYSFAIVLAELFTGRRPYDKFSDVPEVHLLHRIFNDNLRPDVTDVQPDSLRDLIASAWSPVPTDRPTLKDMWTALVELRE